MKKITLILLMLSIYANDSFCIGNGGCTATEIRLAIKNAANPRYAATNCSQPLQVAGGSDSFGFMRVRDVVNNDYAPPNNHRYYFHYGAVGATHCVDENDESNNIVGGNIAEQVLAVSALAGCGFTIWLDLASQCHQCSVQNTYTGTWWKRERAISASEARFGNNIDLGTIPLENGRTSCDSSVQYGCDSGEIS